MGRLFFTTNSDNVDCGTHTDINGITKLTMSMWNYQSSSSNVSSFGKRNVLQRTYLSKDSGGRFYFYLSTTTDAYGYFDATNLLGWNQYTLVYDGTLSGNSNRLKGYLNGVQQTLTFNLTIPAATSSTAGNLYIGGINGTGSVTDIPLAECAMWKVALTPNEVALLGRNYSPEWIRPESLIEYVDLIDNVYSRKNTRLLITGGLPSSHPFIIYRTPIRYSEYAIVPQTTKFRKTLSGIGTKVGSRQIHNWGG